MITLINLSFAKWGKNQTPVYCIVSSSSTMFQLLLLSACLTKIRLIDLLLDGDFFN